VLIAQNDVAIIDFEGEPGRSLAARRTKSSPLRDVAGMLRSFDYAASMALDRHRAAFDGDDRGLERAERWRRETTEGFLAAYREHVAGAATMPDDPKLADALLELFLLQKGIYEIGYELGNRPAWVRIPLRGILDLLARET
jgi:maltose alpha-D-glucosyltransferase/alpha-amylase